MSFSCEICHLEFKSQKYLNSHLKTKKHKQLLDNTGNFYTCTCGKFYSHRQSLHLHKKKCTYVPPVDECNLHETTSGYEESFEKKHIKTRDELIAQFEEEKAAMKAQIEDLLEKSTRTTNNQFIANQQNEIHIHINAFGNENLEYLADGTIEKCINRVYESIPRIIENIHFNPMHPENHNIKITNKKLPHAIVMSQDNKWRMINKDEAINTMMDNGYNILDHKFNEDPSRFTEERRRHYRQFQENYDKDDKETLRRIKNDVELVILNGTKEISQKKVTA